ncbi:MAG: hypothetical protein ABSF61_14065 [Anaerolineales bacterium]|jgi:hypothetical protein
MMDSFFAVSAPGLEASGALELLDSGDDSAERPVGACRYYEAGEVPPDGDFNALYRANLLW